MALLVWDENFQHKGLRHLIEMLAMAGYRHRSEFRVVLYNNNAEADYDDDYAAYLDMKAQGRDNEWDTANGCLKE